MACLVRRWIQEHLDPDTHSRTYLFNSFFFKKLTEKSVPNPSGKADQLSVSIWHMFGLQASLACSHALSLATSHGIVEIILFARQDNSLELCMDVQAWGGSSYRRVTLPTSPHKHRGII